MSFFFGMVSVSAVLPGSQSSLSRNLVSLKAVKDSGLLSNNVREVKMFSFFYSYNDLFHEK